MEHNLAHSVVAQGVVHRVGESVVQGVGGCGTGRGRSSGAERGTQSGRGCSAGHGTLCGKGHSRVHKRSCSAESERGCDRATLRKEPSKSETSVREGIPTV